MFWGSENKDSACIFETLEHISILHSVDKWKWSHEVKRVLKRAISEFYTKVKNDNEKVAGMKVTLKQTDQSEEKWRNGL